MSQLKMSSVSQQIPHILRHPETLYRIHKSLPIARNQSHSNPVHVSPSHFLKILINIMSPSTPRSPK